jgi:hypothetical protein
MSVPNTFSDNLLNNIGNFTGTKPYIREGGNTQDLSLYNASLPTAVDSDKAAGSVIYLAHGQILNSRMASTQPNRQCLRLADSARHGPARVRSLKGQAHSLGIWQ